MAHKWQGQYLDLLYLTFCLSHWLGPLRHETKMG